VSLLFFSPFRVAAVVFGVLIKVPLTLLGVLKKGAKCFVLQLIFYSPALTITF